MIHAERTKHKAGHLSLAMCSYPINSLAALLNETRISLGALRSIFAVLLTLAVLTLFLPLSSRSTVGTIGSSISSHRSKTYINKRLETMSRYRLRDGFYDAADESRESTGYAGLQQLTERLYKYKNFCIVSDVIENNMKYQKGYEDRITMVLHLSSDIFDFKFTQQVKAWDGPVSIAIVLDERNTRHEMDRIQAQLKNDDKLFYGKVSAHLVYNGDDNCSFPESSNIERATRKRSYPVNVARNIARMMSTTEFILIADYEFIFSAGFESQMRKLVKDVTDVDPKTVLVFRIFEYSDFILSPPRDKAALYSLYKKKLVREFHAKYNRGAHSIPGLIEWFERNASRVATIDRLIPYERHDFEPQFVSLYSIPFHDEQFPYPLRDNTVLRWELCRMNYTFAVVNDHFMVHRGMKKPSKAIARLKRFSLPQFSYALRLFDARMARDYPSTVKRCPRPRA